MVYWENEGLHKRMAKLSIIVPAYNEEDFIHEVVTGLLSIRPQIIEETTLDDVEIIVVDDGSRDQTAKLLKDILQKETADHFQVVQHEENRGYGAALKTGFNAAKGEFLSFMDADGTIDPRAFAKMHETLEKENADMVVGTRFGNKGSQMPLTRKVGNRFFALLLSFLAGQRVKDTASGMRLFKREALRMLLPLPDGLHFTPAMSTKALHERIKIAEVPIPYAERQGASKLSVVSDGLRFFRIIVGTVLMYNPFKVFLFFGLLFELVAGLLWSIPLYELFSAKDLLFSDYIYRSIGGVYFSIIGVQIILFGVLARFIVSTFFRQHEPGVLIHKVNRMFRVYDWMGIYGMGVLSIGILINAAYFWKYLFGGGIIFHWAWLLLAAGMIIVGVQMLITGIVMRILKDIKACLVEKDPPEVLSDIS